MSTIAQRLAEDEDIGFNVNKSYGTPSKILDNLMQVESSGNEHAINKETKAMGLINLCRKLLQKCTNEA